MAVIQVKENWTQKPVDRRIFGNFIESGFGRQVNGMWSEMLYNRAFRDVPAIKIATWEWLGLDKAVSYTHLDVYKRQPRSRRR